MMNRREFLPAAVLAWDGLFVAKAKLRADEIPKEYQKPIDKGLEWLAKAQQRDGHWDATGGMYPVAMTAMSGMALLMEGSTLSDGRYSNHLPRPATCPIGSAQPNAA